MCRPAAHILSSALGPAALVLGLAYVATSPALRRAGLYHRMSRVSTLEQRAVRRLRAEAEQVAAAAPSLRPAEALRVARLQLSGAVAPAVDGMAAGVEGAAGPREQRAGRPLSRWWVVTEHGHPALEDTSPDGVTRT